MEKCLYISLMPLLRKFFWICFYDAFLSRFNSFLLDADVISITDGVFKESISLMDSDNRYLAASPEFDYDQNLSGYNYPVLNLVFDVRRDLDFLAVREELDFNFQMAYGMFSVTNAFCWF